METTNSNVRQGMAVSESTALIIDAMQLFAEAKTKLLEGLACVYGEEQANELFCGEYGGRLDGVDSVIFEALGLSVRDNISGGDKGVI